MQQRIDKEIDKRLLNPALNTNYWWKHSRMNWTPWICSNWLTAVLISEKDETRKREAIRQIKAALQTFIDGYPNDGGCDEGTFYWDRAAGSLFDCIELMESFGLTTKEFASNLKVKAMASYIYKMYIGNGFCVNFADAHDNHAVVQLNVLYPFALWTDDITRFMILKLSPCRHYLKIRQPDAFELRFTRLFTLQLTQFCEQK